MKDEKWERIRQIGEGGQSRVTLVRRPERREGLVQAGFRINAALSAQQHSGMTGIKPDYKDLSDALYNVGRPETTGELAVMKEFDKVRGNPQATRSRVAREIEVLSLGLEGMPKLLDSDANTLWLVTEYFPHGSLARNPTLFAGKPLAALKAFKRLVRVISELHNREIQHRDIKPANVFVDDNGSLVLGDFGIAFAADGSRLTVVDERVGPRDYMPQWANTGMRFDEVTPAFDLYMLGKLLWTMASGKAYLPREYFKREQYDLALLFPDVHGMKAINHILSRCVVEDEGQCIRSAILLEFAVDRMIALLERGVEVAENGKIELRCLICGEGTYIQQTTETTVFLSQNGKKDTVPMSAMSVELYSCSTCSHKAFFSPGQPSFANKLAAPQQT